MSKIVYGHFKGYSNKNADTKPGDVVVTRYDKKGNPVKKDYYEVNSSGVPNSELYIEEQFTSEMGEEKYFNKSQSSASKATTKLVKSVPIDELDRQRTNSSKEIGKSFESYHTAMSYAKEASIMTGNSHQVIKIGDKWNVKAG